MSGTTTGRISDTQSGLTLSSISQHTSVSAIGIEVEEEPADTTKRYYPSLSGTTTVRIPAPGLL